jgi:hypothetical protein
LTGWADVWRHRAEQWTYGELESTQIPGDFRKETIVENDSYIDVFLRSMRVVNVRKGLKRFYGTVHSFISLSHLYGETAQFHVLTTPTNLSGIDIKNLDRVLQLNHRLLGSVPYRGGDLKIELGLFSIECEDLAISFIKFLEKIANTAGVSYISSGIPFVGLIGEGVNLFLGVQDSNSLEIGLSTMFDKPHTGYFFVIRAPKDKISMDSLKLDKNFYLTGKTTDGTSIDNYPHMVFSIESSKERKAWVEIPEIAASFKTLNEAIKNNRIEAAKEAFMVFKRIALTSPDLLERDSRTLVDRVDREIKQTMQACLTSGGTKTPFPDLKDILLYQK